MFLTSKGFSFLELLIVTSILTILAIIALPKFEQRQRIALVESSAMKLLSFLKLGASSSVKQNTRLYVHFIPKQENQNACLIISKLSEDLPKNCLLDSQNLIFSFAQNQSVELVSPILTEPSTLFFFSPSTALPSQDTTLLLNANLEAGFESGVKIRRYKGLVGCSQTGVLNWQNCK